MEIEFIKMQSCGCDYVLLDATRKASPPPPHLPDLAAAITSRRFGVGSEGFAVIDGVLQGGFNMTLYQPDGSAAAADPLALRCVSRYAFDSGLVKEDSFIVRTGNLKQGVEVIDGRNISITSGSPYSWDGQAELREHPARAFSRTLSLGEKTYTYTPVLLDRPHAVFYASHYDLGLEEFERLIRDHEDFPRHTSYVRATVLSREALSIRVWETASLEILSAEGGANAAVVASVLNGLSDREVLVHLEGGNLFVEWCEEDNLLYTTGPAEYVFTGTYYYEEEDEKHE
jgi:diaminopimelate epimerase